MNGLHVCTGINQRFRLPDSRVEAWNECQSSLHFYIYFIHFAHHSEWIMIDSLSIWDFACQEKGCFEISDRINCLSVELSGRSNQPGWVSKGSGTQSERLVWGSKDGSTSAAGKGGFKIAGEPCVWCGDGHCPQNEGVMGHKDPKKDPKESRNCMEFLYVLRLALYWEHIFLLFSYCFPPVFHWKPRTCTTDSAAKCAPYDWLMNGKGIVLTSICHWFQHVFNMFQGFRVSDALVVGTLEQSSGILRIPRQSLNCGTIDFTDGVWVIPLDFLHCNEAEGNYNVATCKVQSQRSELIFHQS